MREGGQIECKSCGSMFAAGRFGVEREQRLEGASDAADMLIVVAGLCPRCGTGSTMMLGYGPNSSIEDADVLDELEFENARPLVEPAKRN